MGPIGEYVGNTFISWAMTLGPKWVAHDGRILGVAYAGRLGLIIRQAEQEMALSAPGQEQASGALTLDARFWPRVLKNSYLRRYCAVRHYYERTF